MDNKKIIYLLHLINKFKGNNSFKDQCTGISYVTYCHVLAAQKVMYYYPIQY